MASLPPLHVVRLLPHEHEFIPQQAVGLAPSPLGFRACYFSSEELAALAPGWIANQLAVADEVLALAAGSTWVGILGLRSKPWESEVFGRSMGEFSLFLTADDSREFGLRTALLTAGIARAQELGIEHLTCRLPTSCPRAIQTLETCGFRTVDTLLTLTRPTKPTVLTEPARDFEVRFATAEDLPALASLAGTAFTVDRFHADPFLDGARADEAHREWVRNSVSGAAAEAVLVVARSTPAGRGEALGFLTLARQTIGRLRLCVPGLGAIHQEIRGRGWARRLAEHAVAWAHEHGCAVVEINTQAANIASARTYLGAGFKLLATSQTLSGTFGKGGHEIG
ncbi:MAG: GNAT family N-acetyltransferase [Planctomycetota bacterium]